MSILVSASILGANLSDLAHELKRIENSGVEMIHFDVMDGHFVDNISFGVPVLASLKKASNMFLDVHLMITHPLNFIKSFCDAGADGITFHYESESDVSATIKCIRSQGKKVGLSIKPNTPISSITDYLDKVDMILIMTVEPGFGGQGFIESSLNKIKELKSIICKRELNVDIQVDGGINDITAPLVRGAGANNLVSGSYLFNAGDITLAVEKLKN